MPRNEVAIQLAIQALIDDPSRSLRATAREFNVPRSTLHDRIMGRLPNPESHEHLQRLSREQEDHLVDWILHEDSRGFPPSHARAREMANRILMAGGDYQPVGEYWIKGFLHRNPRVKTIIGRVIDVSRANAANIEDIRAFLLQFKAVRTEYNIRDEDTWNMDETGIGLGICTNTRVLGDAIKTKTYKKSPESREWVSILEAISGDGRTITPGIIFKGQHLQTTWFPSDPYPPWFYTTSENGWTSNKIGVEWLTRIYIPETAPSEPRVRLLILDGHGSHVSVDFLWEAKQANIQLLFLPAHSSHVLQPLDISSFASIKSEYRTEITSLSTLDDAAPIKKERFILCYNKARSSCLNPRIIRAGWKGAGLIPFNVELVLGSSQIIARPGTPPQQQQILQSPPAPYTILTTPQKPQDIYLAQQQLSQSESLSRSVRTVLGKVGLQLGRQNTKLADAQATIARLRAEIEVLKPQKKRKRVKPDPNRRFATINNLKAAQDKVRAEEAKAAQIATQKVNTKDLSNPVASPVHDLTPVL